MSQRNTVKKRMGTVESDKLWVARVSSTNLEREKDLVRHGKLCPNICPGSHGPGDILQRRKQHGARLIFGSGAPGSPASSTQTSQTFIWGTHGVAGLKYTVSRLLAKNLSKRETQGFQTVFVIALASAEHLGLLSYQLGLAHA